MRIEKYGVILESLTLQTAQLVREWRNNPEVNKFMDYREIITIEQQKRWFLSIQASNADYFLIKRGEEPIGMIHVEQIDLKTGTAHVGLFVGESNYHGTGVTLSASVALLEYAFDDLSLLEVIAKVKNNNKEAIEYNQFLGFEKFEQFNNEFTFWKLTATHFAERKSLLLKHLG